jgi:hypothetical protein
MTEPLEGGAPIDMGLDGSGHRVAVGMVDGRVLVWDVPPVSVPVPAWFRRFAETVAGMRVTETGHIELVPRDELDRVAAEITNQNNTDFYTRLARCFLANPAERPPSPF